MRRVILTVGPQGAGKSTFCKKVTESRADMGLVSRDEILREMFGAIYFSNYTGENYAGLIKMWEVIAEKLKRDTMTLIVDCWNSEPDERREFIKKIRDMGADKVEAWYFVTPMEISRTSFFEKSEIKPDPNKKAHPADELLHEMRLEQYAFVWGNFHSLPPTISEGFDSVVRINAASDNKLRMLAES